MPRVAVYAGSFDPPTLGHEDIVRRASPLFDTLYVAVGTHPTKEGFIPVDDRLELMRTSFSDLTNVIVTKFTGMMLVKFCDMCAARYIVRGIRSPADFEYEEVIAHANKSQNPNIETICLVTSPETSFVSSTSVRELAKYNGDLSMFVSPHVERRLKRPFNPLG